jgi:hypothetical protein
MKENKTLRYIVETNGSKSYYHVSDTAPIEPSDSDVCSVWGKREKADRIARGLNLLDALAAIPESATKAQILTVIKECLL